MIKLPEINETQKEALIAHCKECLEIVDRADANIRKSSKYQSPYLQNLLVEHQTQRLNYLITLSYLESPKIIPDGLHQSTAELVIGFATALAEKLHLSEQKYDWSDGWKNTDWKEKCLEDFNHHIDKGDPRDVAAYCAFMWFHGWQTQSLNATAQMDLNERESIKNLKWLFDLSKTCHVLGLPVRLSDSQVEGIAEAFLELEQRLNATAQPVSDGWVKCSERMPIDPLKVSHYSEVEVNVFDGHHVSTATCRAGKPDGRTEDFWVEFDQYGSVNPEDITHWMPLPAAPGGQD